MKFAIRDYENYYMAAILGGFAAILVAFFTLTEFMVCRQTHEFCAISYVCTFTGGALVGVVLLSLMRRYKKTLIHKFIDSNQDNALILGMSILIASMSFAILVFFATPILSCQGSGKGGDCYIATGILPFLIFFIVFSVLWLFKRFWNKTITSDRNQDTIE